MALSSLQDNWPIISMLLIGAYLLGSISSAIVVCKILRLPDPRTEGSNNPGATNVMRLGGKSAALITLTGDVLKGTVPVLLAWYWQLPAFWLASIGLAAFLGHLLPLFFRFQGGKGVATAFGVIFPLYWPVGLATGAVWLLVFALFRISSVASISAFALTPLLIWFWLPSAFWPMFIMMLALLGRHQENVRKLLEGEEQGFKKK